MAAPHSSLNASSENSGEQPGKVYSTDPDSLWQENKRLHSNLERSLTERNRLLKRIQEMNAGPRRGSGSRVLEQRLSETRADADALHRDNATLSAKVQFLQQQLTDSTLQQRVLISRLREAVELAADRSENSNALQGDLPEDSEGLAECSNRIMETLWRLLANNDGFQSRALKEQVGSLKAALAKKQDEALALRQAQAEMAAQEAGMSRDLEEFRANAGLRDQRLVALQERVVELEEESNRLTRSNLKLKSQVKALRGTVDPEMFSYVATHTGDTYQGDTEAAGFSKLRPMLLGTLGGVLLASGAWLLFTGLPGSQQPVTRIFPLEAPRVVRPDPAPRPRTPAPTEPGVQNKIRSDRLSNGAPGPKLTLIQGGEFRMGSDRYGRPDIEGPSRQMHVAPVWMSRNEVSFADYDRFARATGRALPADNGWGRQQRPVINVTWSDARAYAAWMSQQTGEHYRLPTEAEWEFAVAGGADSIYWWGNGFERGREVCFNCGTRWDGRSSAPVGSLEPNSLGLYDMGGNVMEWVADCLEPIDQTGRCGLRVVRGGAYDKPGSALRTTARRGLQADTGYSAVGFRLVREP